MDREPGTAMNFMNPNIQRDEIQKEDDYDDTSEFSPMPGGFNLRQPKVQILKETKIINHVQSIRRTIENEEYRKLKKLVLTYMD